MRVFRWHWLPFPHRCEWHLIPWLSYRGFRTNWSVTWPLLVEGFRWRGPEGQNNDHATVTVSVWRYSVSFCYSRHKENH